MSGENILEVENLTKHFKLSGKQIVHAVDGVSFAIPKGKTLGLVGESGCGKSTCARTVIRMYDVTDGRILLEGKDITKLKQKELKPLRKNMQMMLTSSRTPLWRSVPGSCWEKDSIIPMSIP